MTQLTRYQDPFSELSSIHSQLDDIFGAFLNPRLPAARHAAPSMDVYVDDDKRLVSEIQAAGFTPDDIEIAVNNGTLEIRGEKTEKEADNGKKDKRNYMVRESHASFYRSIVLPKHADADNVTADFEDGVLKVVVPFKELPQPKKVAINSSKK